MTNSPMPTGRDPSADELLDKLSLERLQKLITIETANSATQSIIDRGKWMIGGVAALLAVLGISTYLDVKKSVQSMTEVATKQVLDTELTEYRKQVASKAEQTLKEFEERRTFISSQVTLRITISPASRKVFNAKNTTALPGNLARSEGDPPTGDAVVDEMYEHVGTVLRFWKSEYGRDSYDGKGAEVRVVVRYGQLYNNTLWDGKRLVIGDGAIFKTFSNLKVAASEPMHGVTQHSAAFAYEGQSGALNKHISDAQERDKRMTKSPMPTERDPTPDELLDKLSVERLQKLITIETANNATQSIIDRGKWMIGGVAALLAVLGFKTYLDVKNSIDSITEIATKQVQSQASGILTKFEGDISALQKKLVALDTELIEYRKQVASKAEETLKEFEERRTFISSQVILKVAVSPASRKVFNAKNLTVLPGNLARSEGDPATGDAVVDEMYEHVGTVLRFWKSEYGRDSYDGKGTEVRIVVRYGKLYNNTFWDGQRLVIGDGDGAIFKTFSNLKIAASELMHGVTEHSAAFAYKGQSGALSNHISDVFGTLVEQWKLRQTADQANWLMGDGILAPNIKGVALRSLKAPGTAYDDPLLGKDPQPSTMAGYKNVKEDSGGAHLNSGIPNHAFYLAATKIGGFAWEKPGKVWYEALLASKSDDDFRKFARTTLAKAEAMFGKQSKEWSSIKDAWHDVGIDVGS